jgi:putative membrane protein
MLPVVAFADVEGCGFTWVWNQMMDFGYGGIFMWIIFLTIMIVVFYLIMQSNKSKIYDNSFAESPIDILKKRYAKGEITKEEFEKMKKALKSY